MEFLFFFLLTNLNLITLHILIEMKLRYFHSLFVIILQILWMLYDRIICFSLYKDNSSSSSLNYFRLLIIYYIFFLWYYITFIIRKFYNSIKNRLNYLKRYIINFLKINFYYIIHRFKKKNKRKILTPAKQTNHD